MSAAKSVEPIYQAIGAKMRMLRDILGIQQEDLARRIGKTRASVASMETGRQRILLHDIERIATALGSTPRGFLKGIWF